MECIALRMILNETWHMYTVATVLHQLARLFTINMTFLKMWYTFVWTSEANSDNSQIFFFFAHNSGNCQFQYQKLLTTLICQFFLNFPKQFCMLIALFSTTSRKFWTNLLIFSYAIMKHVGLQFFWMHCSSDDFLTSRLMALIM